jgi:hypothetical protein
MDLLPPGVSAALASLPKPTPAEVESLLAQLAPPPELPTPKELQALVAEAKNKKTVTALVYAREHLQPKIRKLAQLGCEFVVLRVPDGYDKNSFVTAFCEQGYNVSSIFVDETWMSAYETDPVKEQNGVLGHRCSLASTETYRIPVLVVDLRPPPEMIVARPLRVPLWMRVRRFFCCWPVRKQQMLQCSAVMPAEYSQM